MRSTRTAGTSVGGKPGENDRSRDGSAQNFAGGCGEDDDRFEIDSDDGGSGGVSVGLLTSGGSASSGISGRVDHHHSLPLPEGRDDPTPMQTLAGVAGNVLEWYDFAVFGYFGDIIGEVFFPPQAGHAAIVESFAVFGGAFMMRPIGGMIMGYIGDKYGRKRALELSIFLMAFPTFAMGCLPSYDSIGPVAILLLAITRCLQGLSVGGQLMSSLVYTLEQHPKRRWGLYGSYVMAAANVGTLLGGIVGFIMRATLTDEQLHSWGWRVPFLAGILVSLTGLYLKYYCDEDHAGSHGVHAPPNPIKAAFGRANRRSLLSATLVPMLWSAGFYLTFVWLSIFMSDLEVPPLPHAFLVNSASLAFSVCLVFPLGGIISDRYGRRRIMAIGAVCMGVLSPFMIYVIGLDNPVAAFFAQSTMGLSLTLWGAPMMAWLVEAFPPEARLTSVAIGYNIAQATAGGFSPAIATLLVDRYGEHTPGYILSALALTSLTGLLIAPSHQHDQGEDAYRQPVAEMEQDQHEGGDNEEKTRLHHLVSGRDQFEEDSDSSREII